MTRLNMYLPPEPEFDPLVYTNILFNHSSPGECGAFQEFLWTLRSKPKVFFEEKVRRLALIFETECVSGYSLEPDIRSIIEVLNVCSNVTELTLWIPGSNPVVDRDLMEIIVRLPLTRLSLRHLQGKFLTALSSKFAREGDGLSLLTHLDLHKRDLEVTDLEFFPSLTHLAITTSPNPVPLIAAALALPNLRALMMFMRDNESIRRYTQVADPRIIEKVWRTFDMDDEVAKRLPDFWDEADKTIRERLWMVYMGRG